MRKKFLLALIFLLLSSNFAQAVFDPTTVANNRFGIHVLFPDELEQAAKLVNSGSGEWGYVTIPIRSDDKNLEKWQAFLDRAQELKVIPILRLTTYPDGPVWTKPTVYDPLDWANFLESLDWPIQNRYVIVYNEPNHSQEWGGDVNPEEYTQQLVWTVTELKKRSDDFYVLPAGLDASVPSSATSLDEYAYLNRMYNFDRNVFNVIDGWNSHSYPNPNFSASPDNKAKNGITSFAWETNYIKNNFGREFKNIFITETGWNADVLPKWLIADNFTKAFSEVWNKETIVAVTPFLFSAQAGDFTKFSWTDANFVPNDVYRKVSSLAKSKGAPQQKSTQLAQAGKLDVEQPSNWSAQKTGYWQQTTRSMVKTFINFLINE